MSITISRFWLFQKTMSMEEFVNDLFSTPMDVIAVPKGYHSTFSDAQIKTINSIDDKEKKWLVTTILQTRNAANTRLSVFSKLQLSKLSRIKSKLDQQQLTALTEALKKHDVSIEEMPPKLFTEHLLLQGMLTNEQRFALFHANPLRPNNGETVLYTEPYYLFGLIPWGRTKITVADIAKKFLTEGIQRNPITHQPFLTESQKNQLEALRKRLLVDSYQERKDFLAAFKLEMQAMLLSRLKNGIIQVTKKQTITIQSIRGLNGIFNFLTNNIDTAIPNNKSKPRVRVVKIAKPNKQPMAPLPQPVLLLKPDLSLLENGNDIEAVVILRNILNYCETIKGIELTHYLRELQSTAKKIDSPIVLDAIKVLDDICLLRERGRIENAFNEVKHILPADDQHVINLSHQLQQLNGVINSPVDSKKFGRLAYREFFEILARAKAKPEPVAESKLASSPVLIADLLLSAGEIKDEHTEIMIAPVITPAAAVVVEQPTSQPVPVLPDTPDTTLSVVVSMPEQLPSIVVPPTVVAPQKAKVNHEVLIDLYYNCSDIIDKEPKDKLLKQLGICFRLNDKNTLRAVHSFHDRDLHGRYSEQGSAPFQAATSLFKAMPWKDQARALSALIIYAKKKDLELLKYFGRLKNTARNAPFWTDENNMPSINALARDTVNSVTAAAQTAANVSTTAAAGVVVAVGAILGLGM